MSKENIKVLEPIKTGQEIKFYTYKEWVAEAVRLFGKDEKKWKFKCCNCGHEQSIEDFEKHGVEKPESKVHYSCIGRYIGGKGTMGNDLSPCNYTLGGLFNLGKVQVKWEDNDVIYCFEFGTGIEKPANV